jgi:hypothetical protein
MRPLCNLLLLFASFVSLAPPAACASVVINEVFYNAPDDMDDVQWVEFHNTSDRQADMGGWTVDDGKVFTFPAQTTLGPNGYLVVALNPDAFAKSYGDRALGPFKRVLKRGGEKLELKDASGKVVDVARYKDRAPWPVSADGYSASLERICPAAGGDSADNWAASPLPTAPKPSGTPGKKNANYSPTLPPAVTLGATPTDLAPATPLRVETTAKGAKELTLLYRVVAGGSEGGESAVPMAKQTDGRFAASIPGQSTGSLVRYRVKAVGDDGAVRYSPTEHDLRPTLSAYVHEKWEAANVPLGLVIRGGPDKTAGNPAQGGPPGFGGPRGFGGMGGRGPRPNFGGFGRREETPRPPRGSSAFVYVDPKSGKATVFDHISTVPRNNDRGFKIFLHKDHALDGMASVNLAFEGSEWSLMAEALAYELYRRAGSPAPLAEFVRVFVDGKPAGHHLMIERPNRSFLRRNKIDDAGNLYKVQWTGRDPVSQHEKRTNERGNHDDLLAVIDQLTKTAGDPDAQWKLIQEKFDVEQVATYFAINMVLSHWDGFFNNFFPYHDTKRGKWMMFPWDQDKTWGYYDGLPDDQVFFDMPLTYGMEGDRPPGAPAGQGGGRGGFGGGRGGPMWWRPGGYFSRPLLANPHFRKVFLAKTRDVLQRVYTPDVYFPLIDQTAARIAPDSAIRAKLRGEDEAVGGRMLARDAHLLKEHLTRRRQFLLEQSELQAGRDGQR